MRFIGTICGPLLIGLLLILQAQADVRGPQVIYEIFTRSFQDSNGDGIGDLDGVRSRLDYISSLGADAIWLTPIFPSPSYHGYDIADYQSIKSEYGDLSALSNLIADAHQRGIRVFLDVAVNHTSTQHSWFANHDLYLWSPNPQHWPNITLKHRESPEDHWHLLDGAYYFSSFTADMADLNWRNPEVLQKIEDVFNYWTSIGVDGFRLDAAKYLVKGPSGEQNQPETHEIWKQIVASVRQNNPSAYFVGEVWDSSDNIASYYGSGDELDAAFDFPVEDAIRNSISSGNASAMVSALGDQLNNQRDPFFAAPFAGNHDLDRLASVLGQDLAKQKLAALAVLTLPGTPVIYYGDEIGIPQGGDQQSPGDLAKRTPMIWSADEGHGFSSNAPWNSFSTEQDGISVGAQDQDPQSLLNTYRTLIANRKATPALSDGVLSDITPIGSSGVSYVRTAPDGSHVAIVLNFGSQAMPTQILSLRSQRRREPLDPKVIYGKARVSLSSSRGAVAGLLISGLGPKQGLIIRF